MHSLYTQHTLLESQVTVDNGRDKGNGQSSYSVQSTTQIDD